MNQFTSRCGHARNANDLNHAPSLFTVVQIITPYPFNTLSLKHTSEIINILYNKNPQSLPHNSGWVNDVCLKLLTVNRFRNEYPATQKNVCTTPTSVGLKARRIAALLVWKHRHGEYTCCGIVWIKGPSGGLRHCSNEKTVSVSG